MKIKFLLFGIASILPGIFDIFARPTGGTSTAEYCYSVWLRHLITTRAKGQRKIPENVVEIGPGDSLGIGLAALLSGAKTYSALDVHNYSSIEKNLEIFDNLIKLFKTKSRIPLNGSGSKVRPKLNNYAFPSDIITDTILEKSLSEKRIKEIRNSIKSINSGCINYYVPWFGKEIKKSSIDFVIAQASIEYIENTMSVLRYVKSWMKTDSYGSLVIDYSSHHLSNKWNEHWTYSQFMWLILKGRQPFFPNRKTHSEYLDILHSCKFEIIHSERNKKVSQIKRKELNYKFREISEEDLNTAGGYFIIKK